MALLRRIRHRNLVCPAAAPTLFTLRFPARCKIERIALIQARGNTPPSACTAEFYSSPSVATILAGGSSQGYDEPYPDDALNPHIFSVCDPISLTAGNVARLTESTPYFDDNYRMANMGGNIYVVLTPAQANTVWEMFFDIEASSP